MKQTRQILFITVLLIFHQAVMGQSPEYELFTMDPAVTAKQTLPAHETDRQYIQINAAVAETGFLQPGNRLIFPLHNDQAGFEISRAVSYIEGTYSVFATGGPSGDDRMTITFEEGRMTGSLSTGHAEHYHFRFDRDLAQTYMATIDPAMLDHEECTVNAQMTTSSDMSNPHPHHPPANLSALSAIADQEITIDLMIVYTEAAEAWANSSGFASINAVIAESMNLSQSALDNSDVFIELRLVHTHKTDYDETEGNVSANDHLRRFTESPYREIFQDRDYEGYMEEVHDLRDDYGADLVALFASEPGTGGVAWLLNSPSGSPDRGFSVNRVEQIATSYTLIHEIGHNMGNAHARGQNSAPAGEVGGLYEYSTGYRWEEYTTVMGYVEGPYNRIPMFSNPDITWEGSPAGIPAGQESPSDNARSMREVKLAVASYRPTRVDPPVKSIPDNAIEVQMSRGETHTVSLDIANSGDSDLVWNVDFQPVENPSKATMKLAGGTAAAGLQVAEAQPSGTGALFAVADQESPVLFSEDFASSSGFSAGTFSAVQNWRTFNDDAKFEISGENPSAGNQHLRINHMGDQNSIFVRSPYFGPQPFGSYEFTADISLEDLGSSRFDLYLFDENTGNYSGGLLFLNDQIYYLNVNQEGGLSFFSQGFNYSTEGYGTIRIVLDPVNGGVNYYYNDDFVAGTDYIAGNKIDYFRFIFGNEEGGSFVDIDNVKITRPYDPFKWLNVSAYGGITQPGQTSQLNLEFNSEDMPEDDYEADLILRSNDPGFAAVTVPLKLIVSDLATTVKNTDLPNRITLSQNYPNPFNPATVIRFQLAEDTDAVLEVFDMLGRRVTTLIDDQFTAGEHEVRFDATDLSGGMYIYRLTTDHNMLSKKMILIK